MSRAGSASAPVTTITSRPSASSALRPNIRSAAGFQYKMRESRSLTMTDRPIASSTLASNGSLALPTTHPLSALASGRERPSAAPPGRPDLDPWRKVYTCPTCRISSRRAEGGGGGGGSGGVVAEFARNHASNSAGRIAGAQRWPWA